MEDELIAGKAELPVARNRAEAFGRLALALVPVALVGLIAAGVLDADVFAAAVTSVLAVGTTVCAWWKDNNVTLRAILRHEADIEIGEWETVITYDDEEER